MWETKCFGRQRKWPERCKNGTGNRGCESGDNRKQGKSRKPRKQKACSQMADHRTDRKPGSFRNFYRLLWNLRTQGGEQEE